MSLNPTLNSPVNPTPGATRAIVFFAHGSRDPLWQAPMHAIAERAQTLDPARIVRLAYLELCTPSLPDVVAQLANSGVAECAIMPLFLGMGRHAREDLPALLDQLRSAHPGMKFDLLPALGEDSRLIELAARMAVFPAQP